MKIRSMTRCALAASLMAVCAWITIPGPVPYTLQTFALFFVLSALGSKQGAAAVWVYLVLGGLGLPVFSGFQGGIGVLLGPSGGYLTGFLVTCFAYRNLTRLGVPTCAALAVGLLGCYCFGTAWFWLVYGKGKSLWTVVCTCVLPFVIPDGIKLLLAHSLSRRVKKIIGA